MKALTLLAVLFLSAFSFGSTACQSTFRVGASGTSLSFCVTDTGNISAMGMGTVGVYGTDGYGICSASGNYYDLGDYGHSDNWQPAFITQPKGPDTFPLAISRFTADNNFEVIQSFAFAGAGSSVQVKFTVYSFLRPPAPATFFRYADPLSTPSGEYGDDSGRSAFVWNRAGGGFMATPSVNGDGHPILGGAPNVCAWQTPASLPFNGDAAMLLNWPWPGGKLQGSFSYIPMR